MKTALRAAFVVFTLLSAPAFAFDGFKPLGEKCGPGSPEDFIGAAHKAYDARTKQGDCAAAKKALRCCMEHRAANAQTVDGCKGSFEFIEAMEKQDKCGKTAGGSSCGHRTAMAHMKAGMEIYNAGAAGTPADCKAAKTEFERCMKSFDAGKLRRDCQSMLDTVVKSMKNPKDGNCRRSVGP